MCQRKYSRYIERRVETLRGEIDFFGKKKRWAEITFRGPDVVRSSNSQVAGQQASLQVFR